MNSVSLPAYAKVNLFLDVLGKRPDGYHQLLTLFERIDLADTLTVSCATGSGITLECESSQIPRDPTNLVIRAAEAYQKRSGWSQGLSFQLHKRIPVGAGLGGGSSDAAATLLALQGLSGQALSQDALLETAQALGADVAFFTTSCTRAIGKGRGDQIEPLTTKALFWYLLVTPDFPIPTKEVYEAFVPTSSNQPLGPFLELLSNGKSLQAAGFLYNALEPTVEKLYPQIQKVKGQMKAVGLEKPMVSGSGSTVFALCESQAAADSAARELKTRQPAWRTFVTRTAI